MLGTPLKRNLRSFVRHFGYDLIRAGSAGSPAAALPPDFDSGAADLWHTVQPYTMTSPERVFALRDSVAYLIRHQIPGDIVECGVWKGGSMMAVAKALLALGASDRRLHLFDTYEGMCEPTEHDRSFRGEAASTLLQAEPKGTEGGVWAYCPLEEVRQNLAGTGYDPSQMVFVRGRVEETIPEQAPERIALLRLDTDWYESTYHELVHLYPRLSVGGVLVLDDYGYWQGARRAVDQWLEEYRPQLLLFRLDKSARAGVKIG